MKLLAIVGLMGAVPTGILAQTAGASSDAIPWLTGGTVISLAALFYKSLRDQISRLQVQVDALTAAAERRAEEDRKMLIPLLGRSVEAQAAYLSRRLELRDEQDGQ